MSKQKSPNLSLSIRLQNNTYEFNINDLTYGKLIDIERLKIALTQDTHKSMLFTTTRGGQRAYLAVDMISFFTVLFPKMVEDLNVKSILDLSPLKTKQLMEVYNNEFFPWWRDWEDILNKETPEEKKEVLDEKEEADLEAYGLKK